MKAVLLIVLVCLVIALLVSRLRRNHDRRFFLAPLVTTGFSTFLSTLPLSPRFFDFVCEVAQCSAELTSLAIGKSFFDRVVLDACLLMLVLSTVLRHFFLVA